MGTTMKSDQLYMVTYFVPQGLYRSQFDIKAWVSERSFRYLKVKYFGGSKYLGVKFFGGSNILGVQIFWGFNFLGGKHFLGSKF